MLGALSAIQLPCLGASVLTLGQAHEMVALGQGCPAHLATVPTTPSAGGKASLVSIRLTITRRIPVNKDKSPCIVSSRAFDPQWLAKERGDATEQRHIDLCEVRGGLAAGLAKRSIRGLGTSKQAAVNRRI